MTSSLKQWLWRAYYAGYALFFLVVIAAGLNETEAPASEVDAIRAGGPMAIALGIVAAVALGLRTGQRGGVIQLSTADVHLTLTAPIDQQVFFRDRLVARMRSAVIASVLLGAAISMVTGIYLGVGSTIGWTIEGAVYGAVVSSLYYGSACIWSAAGRRGRLMWAATVGAMGTWLVLGFETASSIDWLRVAFAFPLIGDWKVPAALFSLVGAGSAAVALTIGPRIDPEVALRRASLVSTLRFAISQNDLYSIASLYWQLSDERPRRTPWFRVRARRLNRPIVTRFARSLVRFPGGKLLRLVVCAFAIFGILALSLTADSPRILVPLLALVGLSCALELNEPLLREVTAEERLSSYPQSPPSLIFRLLGPALVLMSGIYAACATVACIIAGRPEVIAEACAVSVIAAFAAVLGAAWGVSRKGGFEIRPSDMSVPMEVMVMTVMIRTFLPQVCVLVASIPLVLVGTSEPEVFFAAVIVALAIGVIYPAVSLWRTARAFAARKAGNSILNTARSMLLPSSRDGSLI